MQLRLHWLSRNCPQELLNKKIRVDDFYDLQGSSEVPTASSPTRTRTQKKAQKIVNEMAFSDDSDPGPSASPIQLRSFAQTKEPRVVLTAVNLNERIVESETDQVWFFIIKMKLSILILFIINQIRLQLYLHRKYLNGNLITSQ